MHRLLKYSSTLAVFFLSSVAYSVGLFSHTLLPLNTPVGTLQQTIIDQSRPDPRSKEGLLRELSLRIWYPALDDTGKEFAKWGYDDRGLIVEREAAAVGVPQFLITLAHLDRVRSKAELQPESGLFPVVFLLQGLGEGHIANHTDLAETLAASGFIVIGLSMPYGSGYLKISQSPSLIEYSAELKEIMSRYPASKPELIAYRLKEHAIWVDDVLFALSRLSHGSQSVLMHADWKHVFLVGHSHGGMVALDSCIHMDQCMASVNLDGFTYDLQLPPNYKQHLVFYVPSSGGYMRSYCSGKANCTSREVSCDIAHSGFTDAVYVK